MTYTEKAIEKLDSVSADTLEKKSRIVCDSVRNALKTFCLQSDEFAQAIVQGGDFKDCLKTALTGVTEGISDLELYIKAVGFYFAGAKVECEMKLDLGDGGFSGADEKKEINLSLDSLFDF